MSIYYHHKTGSVKNPKSSKTSKKKLLLLLLIPALILISSYAWYKVSLKPVGAGEYKSFNVESGQSVSEIMDKLEEQDLIRSSTALKIHARFNGTFAKLKVGSYSISPELSGPQIVEIISGGRVANSKLTILAGKTVDELLPQFYQHFGREDVDSTLSSLTSDFHPILASQPSPRAVNLEGYILPETYTDLDASVTFESWLKRNFDLFSKRIEPSVAGFTARGFSTQQAFTLASIVQQESSVPEEQRTIAQVFELRLEQGISLGADPTFIYAAKLKGVEPNVNIDSPYNTRLNKGLPPTPIGTFELTALEAVANPSATDYLFFVAGDDGTIYYSRTNAEHEANIQKYCVENCSLF